MPVRLPTWREISWSTTLEAAGTPAEILGLCELPALAPDQGAWRVEILSAIFMPTGGDHTTYAPSLVACTSGGGSVTIDTVGIGLNSLSTSDRCQVGTHAYQGNMAPFASSLDGTPDGVASFVAADGYIGASLGAAGGTSLTVALRVAARLFPVRTADLYT